MCRLDLDYGDIIPGMEITILVSHSNIYSRDIQFLCQVSCRLSAAGKIVAKNARLHALDTSIFKTYLTPFSI